MKYQAVVTRVVQESSRISTIFFKIRGSEFSYTAGQYICVYFDETGNKSGKAYSLSSAPHDSELSITVKKIGQFSKLICALKPGGYMQVSSPFGYFNSNDELPIVAIAAGVGIAPIWSIIRDELRSNINRDITLYLTASHEEELVFHDAVNGVFKLGTSSTAHYFVTQEPSSRAEHRRFAVNTDLSEKVCATSRFYICGSESFVRGIWIQLMEAGVAEQRIVAETFFESAI